MSNVVTIKADDSNMRETTDIVDKLNKLFDGTSLVAEIVTKETRSMNGKSSYESYIKIEKGDWMEILMIIFVLLMILKVFKEVFFILLVEMNFYFFKKRCNKFLKDAKCKKMHSRNELLTWFKVEQRAYKKRQEKIDDLYDLCSLIKEH